MVNLENVVDSDTAKRIAQLALSEVARLQRRLVELTHELAAAKGQDRGEQLPLELKLLQERIDKLQKDMFAPSSERGDAPPKPACDPKPKREHGHGPTKQQELEVVEQTYKLDPELAVKSWEPRFG